MIKYYRELYLATLAESAKELTKPVADVDWDKMRELNNKAIEYFKKAMGEA